MKKLITLILLCLFIMSGCTSNKKGYLDDENNLKMFNFVKANCKRILESKDLIDEKSNYVIEKEKNDQFPMLFNMVVNNVVVDTIQVQFYNDIGERNGWYSVYKDGYIGCDVLAESKEFHSYEYQVDVTNWMTYKDVTEVKKTEYIVSEATKENFENNVESTIDSVRMLLNITKDDEITFGSFEIERYMVQYDQKNTLVISPLNDYLYCPVYVNGELKAILDYRCSKDGESWSTSVDVDELLKCYNDHYLVAMIEGTAITEEGLIQIYGNKIPYIIQKAYDILNKH